MSSLITFENMEFGKLTVMEKDGEFFFIGKEVAEKGRIKVNGVLAKSSTFYQHFGSVILIFTTGSIRDFLLYNKTVFICEVLLFIY